MNLTKLLGEDGTIALASLAVGVGLSCLNVAANQPSIPVYHQSKSPVFQFYSIPRPIGTTERFSSERTKALNFTDFGPTPVAEPTETVFYGLYRRRERFEK